MHEELLSKLRNFEKRNNFCNKVYCSTCGGLASIVRDNMTEELNDYIKSALSEMSIENFLNLGDWSGFLSSEYRSEVILIFEREEANIDIQDINQLDKYLLRARGFMNDRSSYIKLVESGVQISMETSNESLLETVAIILGKEILEPRYSQLLKLAMQKSKTNRKIHRVLYNNLREEVPEVRGYVGNDPQPAGSLEIKYLSGSEEKFKQELLENRKAYIKIYYTNGTTEIKEWKASRFKSTSSVDANLRSGYLRDWKKEGIYKAELSVNKNEIA